LKNADPEQPAKGLTKLDARRYSQNSNSYVSRQKSSNIRAIYYQIADQLVISPRTVNTHLKAIYSKIGVSSRVAATRYAMEHHLV
jgi:DNA-binding CsgD family transcriptional regulator